MSRQESYQDVYQHPLRWRDFGGKRPFVEFRYWTMLAMFIAFVAGFVPCEAAGLLVWAGLAVVGVGASLFWMLATMALAGVAVAGAETWLFMREVKHGRSPWGVAQMLAKEAGCWLRCRRELRASRALAGVRTVRASRIRRAELAR